MEKNLNQSIPSDKPVFRAIFVGQEEHGPALCISRGRLRFANLNYGQTGDAVFDNRNRLFVKTDGQNKWRHFARCWFWIPELDTENEHWEKHPVMTQL